jgi:hypothetical protein
VLNEVPVLVVVSDCTVMVVVPVCSSEVVLLATEEVVE